MPDSFRQWPKSLSLKKIKNPLLLTGALLIFAVYGLELLSNPRGLHYGDADFFFAMGEAFRISVLEFHQFPWLNPWIAGGVPLYADPQFGLISIQSIMILPFGAVIGWKLAIITYIIIGYLGLYRLLGQVFNTEKITALIVSLTWAFAGIWMVRATGHFTFFGFAFLPWVLYYLWARNKVPWSAIKLGLVCVLAINSSPHNTTIMLLTILGVAILFEFIFLKKNQIKSYLKFILIFVAITIPLTIHKLFFTYKYAGGNAVDRVSDPEEYPGIKNIAEALFGYGPQPGLLPSGWGKGEALVGLGFGPLVILVLLVGTAVWLCGKKAGSLRKIAKKYLSGAKAPLIFIVLMTIGTLTLAAGDFAKTSPYGLLRELPVFENTRVAVRWLIPAGLSILILISAIRYSRIQRSIVNIVLGINLILLIFFAIKTPNSYTLPDKIANVPTKNFHTPPKQLSRWEAPRRTSLTHDDNLYLATKNNIDQISTNLVPFFDTKFGGTQRCNEISSKTCKFVRSDNARVVYWSPNRIVLERTSPGIVELNINPIKYWLLNDKEYLFSKGKYVDPNERFKIDSETQHIVLEYAPPLTIDWLEVKL